MNRFRRNAGLTIILGTALLAHPNAVQAAGVATAQLTEDANVHQSPSSSSPVLGRYPQGTNLRVLLPAQSGWYAMKFSTPVKGSSTGWIEGSVLNLAGPKTSAASPSSPKKSRPRRDPWWIALFGDLHSFHPATYQATLGEPSASFFSLGESLELGHYFSPDFSGAFRISHFSFTNTAVNASTSKMADYFASGYTFMLHFLYDAYASRGGFTAGLGGGIGIGAITAGDTTQTEQYITPNFLSFPIEIKLSLSQTIGGKESGFSARGELGYEIMSVGNVPVLLPTGQPHDGTANLSLSGVVVSLGVLYAL